MKEGYVSLTGKLFVITFVPILFGTGCRSNQSTSANLGPASASQYQGSTIQASPTETASFNANEDLNDIYAGNSTSSKPSESTVMPFKLRNGETLVSHKVVKGDNLSKIAKIYGTNYKRIMAANGMTNDRIIAGKSYKVPTKMSADEIAMADKPKTSKVTTVLKTNSAPKPPAYTTGGYNTKPATTNSSYKPYKAPTSSGGYSSSANRTYSGSTTPPASNSFSRSYSAPKTSTPKFEARTFNVPTIPNPDRSSSITIPSGESSGSGAAFPTPTFGTSSF